MLVAALLLAGALPEQPRLAGSVKEAMTTAVAFGCFLHANGLSPIKAARQRELAAAGLSYAPAPPADMVQAVAGLPSAWGKAQFAKVTWTGGDAWVVGFEHGQCLIDATSTEGASLVDALHAQFETPGVPWHKLPPMSASERYAVAVQPPGRPAIAIVANVVGMDLPPAGRKEIVTFEVTENK